MLLSSLFFSAMAVCVKFAAQFYTPLELVGYRGLISCVILVVLMRRNGIALKTPVPGMHFWRTLVGVISLLAWFYALSGLPLATAMTLNYMSSIWIAAFLLGGSLLGSQTKIDPRLILTLLCGFAGVVLILRPTIEQNQLWSGLIGLMSGMVAALAYIQVAALGKVGEPGSRTVLYFALGAAVTGLIGAAFYGGYSPVTWQGLAWMIPIGVLATLGQIFMTRAYSSGKTLVVANLQYAGIVFSALLGIVFFNERLGALSWLGMALIIASGIAATVLRDKVVKPSDSAVQD
jgi:S-adenosylmethionine uptake transporter